MDLAHVKLWTEHEGRVARLVVDGRDISGLVTDLTITATAQEGPPMLEVWYPCSAIEVDGEMRVRHLCPIGEEPES